jgi:hypothetical protein
MPGAFRFGGMPGRPVLRGFCGAAGRRGAAGFAAWAPGTWSVVPQEPQTKLLPGDIDATSKRALHLGQDTIAMECSTG